MVSIDAIQLFNSFLSIGNVITPAAIQARFDFVIKGTSGEHEKSTSREISRRMLCTRYTRWSTSREISRRMQCTRYTRWSTSRGISRRMQCTRYTRLFALLFHYYICAAFLHLDTQFFIAWTFSLQTIQFFLINSQLVYFEHLSQF